ncbi:LPXTG cell wall anchor domain-containing protein, partial [Peptostreptococcus porci]|uniref:LPXTG cell wall anchor domain-containing protein n=1 Tax=Peptostreptococcus porci TaxID=2652282 RepID=UPI0023EF800E
PIDEEYKTDNEELKPKTLKDKDGKTYVLTKAETRKDSDPKDGTVKEKTQYVKYEYKETGAVRVKYFIEGTTTELDNPTAGERVSVGDTDEGWYTVKNPGSEIGEEYKSDNDVLKPMYLKDKSGNTYKLTAKEVRDDSDPKDGKVNADTQYIVYEYKLVKGDVYVKYFIEGTDTELENPKAKDKTKEGWYTVKKDSPIDEEYKTDNEDLKPKTLKDKDGKTYVLTKKEIREGSDPKDGTVKETAQYVKYEYKETGAVRVKYFIEGTNIELDNPTAGERVKEGETDGGWYTVKNPGSEIGEEYKTDNDVLKPMQLKDKYGNLYKLTAKEVRDDSDPKDGKVKADTQYIVYEYKLVKDIPNKPNPESPKTNTPNKPNAINKLPKTGDSSEIGLYFGLILLSVSGLLLVSRKRKCK